MLKKIAYDGLARFDHGWLDTRHHFSFADYYDPANMGFGSIRVINDDLVAPGTGFGLHPHRDMEIVSYILQGELTHADSMGNQRTLSRGDIQYMSAGTGIRHSEHNLGKDTLRFLQMWIIPDAKGYEPAYGDSRIEAEERRGRWVTLASDRDVQARFRIRQAADIFAAELSAGEKLELTLSGRKGIYLVNAEGESMVNEVKLGHGDAVASDEDLVIATDGSAHLIALRTGEL